MKAKAAVSIVLSAFLTLLALVPPGAGEEHSFTFYLLKVASIGFPTWQLQKDAWRVNELKVFRDKLYIGYGDYGVNTGPTDVLTYDLLKEEFGKEFTVDEEAIDRFVVLDGKLVIPGVDATESWDFGNVYVQTETGWRKHRTVPRGLHVFDLASYRKKWYAGIGSNFEFGKGEPPAFGAILSSADEGATWGLEYGTPSDKQSVFRVNALSAFKDKLYGFPFAYTGMAKDEIPKEFWSYLGKPYGMQDGKELYLVLLSDPLGEADAVVYDGKAWKPLNLIPGPNVLRVTPFVYKDKLLLSVVFGTYAASLPDYVALHKKLPPHVSSALYVYDGEKVQRLPFAYDQIRDVVIREDRLFLLVLMEGRYWIVEGRDLKTFTRYLLPQSLEEPLSLEYNGNSFYVGLKDGNIMKTVGFEAIADVAAAENEQPCRIFGGGELPRDGKRYWAAVTDWQEWGKPANFSGEVTPYNLVQVTTRNASGLVIYPPKCLIDSLKPVTLILDGQEVYRGRMNRGTEFTCTRRADGTWKARKGDGRIEDFRPARKVVGKTTIDLTRKGENPTAGLWKAEAVRWAAGAEVALINAGGIRKDLKKGNILVEDLFDLGYRNTLCTLRVKGKTLKEWLAKSLALPEGDRVIVAGCEFTYEAHSDPKQNKLVSASLDPERDYLVATSNYLVSEAKEYFGEEIKAQDTKTLEPLALLRWLDRFEKIGTPTPRVTVIRAK